MGLLATEEAGKVEFVKWKQDADAGISHIIAGGSFGHLRSSEQHANGTSRLASYD